MTNAMIIFMESQKLAEEGVLNYTGREVTYVDEKGEEQIYKEVEPIHTYAMWKELGYQVQKGERQKHRLLFGSLYQVKKKNQMKNRIAKCS